MRYFQIALLAAAVCGLQSTSLPFPRTGQDLQKVSEFMIADFGKLYTTYRTTGIITPGLKRYIDALRLPNYLYQKDFKNFKEERQTTLCLLCRVTVNVLLEYRRIDEVTDQFMSDLAYDICIKFNIQPPNICEGVIDLNLETFLHIIDYRPKLQSDTMCGLILQSGACVVDNDELEWSVTLDENKPDIEVETKQSDEDDLTIVQISDIHYDPAYKVGGNAVCGEPMCCRHTQGEPATPEAAAGQWGDYRDCDMSWEAVEDLLEHVNDRHKKIDYVYFTGDILDHGVWETTHSGNVESITKSLAEFKRVFGDVPVFPILGNHEPHPLNVFAPNDVPQELSTQWLYDLVAEEWGRWLPEETKETIKRGGYYTVLVRPGFRIIALNNNVCYTFNWWLMYEPQYPVDQLNWLAETLLNSEQNGEKVHILAHIPTGESSCFKTFAREYRRIVDRFSHVITAQFNGHTHRDEFAIFYDRKTGVPNNVAYNGGSGTAYSFVNPNYRVYQVEPKTYDVLDYQSYIYNLTAANLSPTQSPDWYLMYSFKDAYNVKSLSPASFDELAQRFASDRSLLYKYFEYKVKLGDPSLETGCDDDCLDNHLCEMLTTEFGDSSKCDEYIVNRE